MADHFGILDTPAVAAYTDLVDMHALTSGEATLPRDAAPGTTIQLSTGNLRIGMFTARKTEAITSLRILCGGTGAGATPTVIRLGVWSVDAAGNLTAITTTANDTTLLVTPSTAYTKALSATWSKIAGQRYALGALVVTAATAPTVLGQAAVVATEMALAPRRCALVGSQSDLPGDIAVGSLSNSTNVPYIAAAP